MKCVPFSVCCNSGPDNAHRDEARGCVASNACGEAIGVGDAREVVLRIVGVVGGIVGGVGDGDQAVGVVVGEAHGRAARVRGL